MEEGDGGVEEERRKMEDKEKVSRENRKVNFNQQNCQQAAGRQNSEIVTVLFLQKLNIRLGGAAEPLFSGGGTICPHRFPKNRNILQRCCAGLA